MSRSVAQARQNRCLALSRSLFALKMTLWPESGWNLTRSGRKFSYGSSFQFALCMLVNQRENFIFDQESLSAIFQKVNNSESHFSANSVFPAASLDPTDDNEMSLLTH